MPGSRRRTSNRCQNLIQRRKCQNGPQLERVLNDEVRPVDVIAALAGVAPYNDDSGKNKGKRHISGGRFAVRRSLYMASWIVIRYQPEFNARYKALRDKGKCAKVALIACMRVLLIRLNAMIRDGSEWKEHIA